MSNGCRTQVANFRCLRVAMRSWASSQSSAELACNTAADRGAAFALRDAHTSCKNCSMSNTNSTLSLCSKTVYKRHRRMTPHPT
eukprot:5346001-Alexandrium_andersonii.AAC.1